VRATPNQRHSRLKQSWLRILQAGAGSLVVATAVVAAPPALAAHLLPAASVEDKLQQARDSLRKGVSAPNGEQPAVERLAWWGNRWGNGGWGHPAWHNWPNWHNWHNWHNWGNW
jgi:hypothetical protein